MALLSAKALMSTKLTFFLFTLPLAMAQDLSKAPTPTSSTTPSPTTSDENPTVVDSAGQQQGSQDTVSLVNYYFIFLALIIIVALVAVFFMWKRKRRYGVNLQQSRENALARDVGAWDPIRARRRYWQGRWRSTDMSQEEGLNEHGEAPPPYFPKSEDMGVTGHGGGDRLAVPMQTLSREQAGFKPPDYSEATERPMGSRGGISTATAGSSSQHLERYG